MRNQAECLALLEALTTDYSNFLAAAAIPPGSPLHLAYVLMGIGSSSGSSASAEDIGDAVDDNLRASPLAVSVATLPLPSGAASETTLNNILTQLQGDRAIASQLFSDATNTIYLRVLAYNQQTNSYESVALTLAGAPYTPTAPETPLQRTDYDTTETVWEIITNGTGYTVGDIVSQFTLISQTPIVAVAAVLWYNQTTQAAINAPLAGHRRRIGAATATEATLSAVNSKLPTLGAKNSSGSISVTPSSDGFGVTNTGIGLPNDSIATSDSGAFSLISLIKRFLTRISAPKISTRVVFSTSGDNTIVNAPGAGLRIVITALRIQNNTDISTTVLIRDGASTIAGVITTVAGTGIDDDFT